MNILHNHNNISINCRYDEAIVTSNSISSSPTTNIKKRPTSPTDSLFAQTLSTLLKRRYQQGQGYSNSILPDVKITLSS